MCIRDRSNLNVSFELKDSQEVSLLILDLQGRVIMDKTITGNSGMNTHELETTLLDQGTYLLVLNNANERIIERFVVHK